MGGLLYLRKWKLRGIRDTREGKGGGRRHCTVHVVYMYPTDSASYGEIPNWAEALGPQGLHTPCCSPLLVSKLQQQEEHEKVDLGLAVIPKESA